MSNHVLLERAVRRPHVDAPRLPAGARYDAASGCWQTGENGDLRPPNPAGVLRPESPRRPPPDAVCRP